MESLRIFREFNFCKGNQGIIRQFITRGELREIFKLFSLNCLFWLEKLVAYLESGTKLGCGIKEFYLHSQGYKGKFREF